MVKAPDSEFSPITSPDWHKRRERINSRYTDSARLPTNLPCGCWDELQITSEVARASLRRSYPFSRSGHPVRQNRSMTCRHLITEKDFGLLRTNLGTDRGSLRPPRKK